MVLQVARRITSAARLPIVARRCGSGPRADRWCRGCGRSAARRPAARRRAGGAGRDEAPARARASKPARSPEADASTRLARRRRPASLAAPCEPSAGRARGRTHAGRRGCALLEVAEPGVESRERLRRAAPRGGRTRPQPAASARSMISRREARARRRSRPSAAAYLVDQPLELARPRRATRRRASGGVRWPIVTAPRRRLACAASPGLLTMNG